MPSRRHLRSRPPARNRRFKLPLTGRSIRVAVPIATLLAICAWSLPASSAAATLAGLPAPAETGTAVARPAISDVPSATKPYTPCPPDGNTGVECNLVIEPQPIKTAAGYQLPEGGPLLSG